MLERGSGSHWLHAGTTRVRSNGTYGFAVKPGGAGLFHYRARFVATSVLAAACSGVLTLRVNLARTRTSISINHSSVRVHSAAIVSGLVSPNMRSHAVYLQVRSGHRWRSIRHEDLSARSRYTFTIRPTHIGTAHYRVYLPASPRRSTASASRTVTLTAHRKPAPRSHPQSPAAPRGTARAYRRVRTSTATAVRATAVGTSMGLSASRAATPTAGRCLRPDHDGVA